MTVSEVKQEKIKLLFEQGETLTDIAREMNLDRKTVRTYLDISQTQKIEENAETITNQEQQIENMAKNPLEPIYNSEEDDRKLRILIIEDSIEIKVFKFDAISYRLLNEYWNQKIQAGLRETTDDKGQHVNLRGESDAEAGNIDTL